MKNERKSWRKRKKTRERDTETNGIDKRLNKERENNANEEEGEQNE